MTDLWLDDWIRFIGATMLACLLAAGLLWAGYCIGARDCRHAAMDAQATARHAVRMLESATELGESCLASARARLEARDALDIVDLGGGK